MTWKSLLTLPENTGFMSFSKKPFYIQTLFSSKNLSRKAKKLKKIWPRKRLRKKNADEEPKKKRKGCLKKSWESNKKKSKKESKLKEEPNKLLKSTWNNKRMPKSNRQNKEEPEDSFRLEEALIWQSSWKETLPNWKKTSLKTKASLKSRKKPLNLLWNHQSHSCLTSTLVRVQNVN